MGYKPGTVPPYPGYIGGGASRGYSRSGAAEAAPAGSFLVTSEAQGDGTGLCCYDAAYSTLLDAPGGSAASDGGAVGSISDVSGNESPITQSTAGSRPTLDEDGLGGGHCITFDGGDFLNLSSFGGGDESQATTVVVVFQMADTDAQFVVDGDTTSHYFRIQSMDYAMAAGSAIVTNSNLADTDPHVAIVLFNGASSSIWIDNPSSAVLTGDAGTNAMDGITLGARADETFPITNGGKVAALAIYDGDIGATARSYIWTQAQARWGLT